MSHLKMIFFVMAILCAIPAFAGKKAKVITESGKKWDVLFLKMSNDTIFLKARKPNGVLFSISGHKSKFQKVEFDEGGALDFSLHDFTPAESPNKPKDENASTQRDTVSLPTPSEQKSQKDTVSLSDQTPTETWTPSTSSFAPPLYQTAKPDTAAAKPVVKPVVKPVIADTVEKTRPIEKIAVKAPLDSGATLTIESKPTKALVRIDGIEVEGTTPLIAKHLTVGEHTVVAYNNSLQVSKVVYLGKGEKKRLRLTLEKIKTQQSAGIKTKSHGLGISISLLSIASLAGSAGTYYLYRRDHDKQLKSFEYLNNSTVRGPEVDRVLRENQTQHESSQTKLNFSQVLFGTGVVLLGAGIILYF